MHDPGGTKLILDKLRGNFGASGESAAKYLKAWLEGEVPYSFPETIAAHLDERHFALILDAFGQTLPLGTGGRRGPVGYGPNRMNPTTLAMTVQGHCNFLREHFRGASLAVIVANDVRVFNDVSGVYQFLPVSHPLLGMSSRTLGKLACEIYAGNGIVSYFQNPERHHGLLSTPEMSFAVRLLGAAGGINLSASHNPPDDNGIKIYNEFGSQPVAPQDERLVFSIQQADTVRTLGFEKAVAVGLIRWLPDECHDKYMSAYVDLHGSGELPDQEATLVYTSLNGCGGASAGELLLRLGYRVIRPPGDEPDGSFASVPLKAPNPEVPQATEHARKYADEKGARIVLSSDPDADRVGVDAKLRDGSWYHFDGNQIAAILCHFLVLNPKGPQRRGLIIETFVTTKILAEIARKANLDLIDNLPVGMKYVADVLNELEVRGRFGEISCSPSNLAFAAEESHGVIISPSIREKDAAPACMFLARIHQMLEHEGRNLLDYYLEILNELGPHDAVNRSILMKGAEGARIRDAIMSSLRQTPPTLLAGRQVCESIDFLDEQRFGPFKGTTDRLARDTLEYRTRDLIVALRPSGTEPKLKFYCHYIPMNEGRSLEDLSSLEQLRRESNTAARQVYNEFLARAGWSLGEIGLAIPDIVDLGLKRSFERETMPVLRERLLTGDFQALSAAIDWLRLQTATMTPGADPIPAIKEAVAMQCTRWLAETPGLPRIVTELEAWATE